MSLPGRYIWPKVSLTQTLTKCQPEPKPHLQGVHLSAERLSENLNTLCILGLASQRSYERPITLMDSYCSWYCYDLSLCLDPQLVKHLGDPNNCMKGITQWIVHSGKLYPQFLQYSQSGRMHFLRENFTDVGHMADLSFHLILSPHFTELVIFMASTSGIKVSCVLYYYRWVSDWSVSQSVRWWLAASAAEDVWWCRPPSNPWRCVMQASGQTSTQRKYFSIFSWKYI